MFNARIGRKNFTLAVLPLSFFIALLSIYFGREIGAAYTAMISIIPPFMLFADAPINISGMSIIVTLLQLLSILLLASLIVRRFHDIGWSAAVVFFALAMLLIFLMFFGVALSQYGSYIPAYILYFVFFVVAVILFFFKGSEGDNRYGSPDSAAFFWKSISPVRL